MSVSLSKFSSKSYQFIENVNCYNKYSILVDWVLESATNKNLESNSLNVHDE